MQEATEPITHSQPEKITMKTWMDMKGEIEKPSPPCHPFMIFKTFMVEIFFLLSQPEKLTMKSRKDMKGETKGAFPPNYVPAKKIQNIQEIPGLEDWPQKGAKGAKL